MSAYPPLTIRIVRSTVLGVGFVASHLVALLAVLLTVALPLWIRAAIGLAVILSLLRALRGWARHDALAVLALEVSVRGELRALYRQQWGVAEVLDGSLVTPAICSLRLQLQDQTRVWVLLLPDSADQHELRRLRVWLRWRRK